MPDYYGSFIGADTLRGRATSSGERSTLSFAADVVHLPLRQQRRPRLAGRVGRAGDGRVSPDSSRSGAATATSLYARVLLPLDTARQSGVATGLELGGSLPDAAGAAGRHRRRAGAGRAGRHRRRARPTAASSRSRSAEAWLRLRPWVALCGRGARAPRPSRPNATLSRLCPALAARFAAAAAGLGGRLSSSRWPGRDRTDLMAGLFAGYTPN